MILDINSEDDDILLRTHHVELIEIAGLEANAKIVFVNTQTGEVRVLDESDPDIENPPIVVVYVKPSDINITFTDQCPFHKFYPDGGSA